MPYEEALDLQRELNQRVIDGHSPPTILMVEHDPVITLTRRPSVRDHLLADDQRLSRLGVATAETDRGGDITYHGPGQLVVYPILKLGDFGLNLSSYMRLLEQAVIDTAAHWGIQAHRECGATGVWVDQAQRLAGDAQRPATTAKLCAMGVRIRKNTTMHGLALNVDPAMDHFDLIVPCGLADRSVTSLKRLLGDDCPSLDEVKQCLCATMRDQLMLPRSSDAGCSRRATPGGRTV